MNDHYFHENRNFLILNVHLNQHELLELVFEKIVDDKRDFVYKIQKYRFLKRFYDQKYRFLKRVCDED